MRIPIAILWFFVLAIPAKSQQYSFTLTGAPHCGCTDSGNGRFTLGSPTLVNGAQLYPITQLSGVLNGQFLTLNSSSFALGNLFNVATLSIASMSNLAIGEPSAPPIPQGLHWQIWPGSPSNFLYQVSQGTSAPTQISFSVTPVASIFSPMSRRTQPAGSSFVSFVQRIQPRPLLTRSVVVRGPVRRTRPEVSFSIPLRFKF